MVATDPPRAQLTVSDWKSPAYGGLISLRQGIENGNTMTFTLLLPSKETQLCHGPGCRDRPFPSAGSLGMEPFKAVLSGKTRFATGFQEHCLERKCVCVCAHARVHARVQHPHHTREGQKQTLKWPHCSSRISYHH